MRQADPELAFDPRPEALDPQAIARWHQGPGYEWLWLNYHRGLHSRWTPEEVARHKSGSRRILITMHDTFGEAPPDPLCQQLHDLADVFVVHEPCEGLSKQVLIRQGVPDWSGVLQYELEFRRNRWGARPILGTVGFNFPWKNFDRLAEVTVDCGWAYLVCSNNATDDDEKRWMAANPYTLVIRGFQPTKTLVSYLAGCDATCFAYECANSGTSGAIRLGLAARKPLLAFHACRQFRDLWEDRDSADTIRWCDFKTLPYNLRTVPILRVDPSIVYLAERDSWVRQGQKYAALFRGLA
jgi:hypothetical protein